MKGSSKYIGKIFEGRFQVVERVENHREPYFILENIYNHERIEIGNTSFNNLINGKAKISNIIRMRIHRTDRKHFGLNGIGVKLSERGKNK